MTGPRRRRKSDLFGLLLIVLVPTSLATPTVFVHTNPQTACDMVGFECPEGRRVTCTRMGGSSNTSRGMKGGSIRALCDAEHELETTRLSVAQWGATGVLVLVSGVILALVLRRDLRK